MATNNLENGAAGIRGDRPRHGVGRQRRCSLSDIRPQRSSRSVLVICDFRSQAAGGVVPTGPQPPRRPSFINRRVFDHLLEGLNKIFTNTESDRGELKELRQHRELFVAVQIKCQSLAWSELMDITQEFPHMKYSKVLLGRRDCIPVCFNGEDRTKQRTVCS